MYFLKLIGQFYQDMKHQKLRTFLTVCGICWGTIAVVLLMAFGVGLEKHALKSFHGMGKGVAILSSGKTTKAYLGMGKGREILLCPDDAFLLQNRIPGIENISPEFVRWGARICYRREARSVGVNGVAPSFEDMRNMIPESGGRFINQLDIEQRRRAVFLGTEIRNKLFGEGADAVGRMITIGGTPFTVVGVLKKKLQLNSYGGQDENTAYIPYTTFQTIFGSLYVEHIIYRPADPHRAKEVGDEVYRVLGARYKFDPEDKEALRLWDTNRNDQFFGYFFLGFKIFLMVGGLFTLLVGAVGVANIMYIVVRERRREVGIKMAVGATPFTILFQFLIETFLIVAFGGVLGFAFSFGLVQLFHHPLLAQITKYVGVPLISPAVALGAVTVLGVIGFAAGYGPARRAARLNPVQALEF